MRARVVSEAEFADAIRVRLADIAEPIGCVTGPGRSGAVAAVYASHILRVPFVPFTCEAPVHLGRLLIIDTATETGRTLRKARARYITCNPILLAVYQEPPRVMFWYESPKPQFYRHELSLSDST